MSNAISVPNARQSTEGNQSESTRELIPLTNTDDGAQAVMGLVQRHDLLRLRRRSGLFPDFGENLPGRWSPSY